MNLYERIKSQVTPLDAIQQYGVTVTPGGMICCPFHREKTPSLKLYDDHFYCFGCHRSGDVISLTGEILDLSPGEAVKRLAADFGIGPDQPPPAMAMPRPKIQNMERLLTRMLLDYLSLMKRFQKDYQPLSPAVPLDPRFIQSCHRMSYIQYLLACMLEDPEGTIRMMVHTGLHRKLTRELEKYEAQEGCAAA